MTTTTTSRTTTVCVAVLDGTYGEDRVRVRCLGKASRHAGKFITIGGGYAGRIAYSEQHNAMRGIETGDVRFKRWEVPQTHE